MSDGTVTSASPDDTVRVTGLPIAVLDPDAGLALITLPFVTVLLGLSTMVAVRPAEASVDSATPCETPVSPVGTVTFLTEGPTATFKVTVSPFLTRELAEGSVDSTVPGVSEET
jgi:hypothetical protein